MLEERKEKVNAPCKFKVYNEKKKIYEEHHPAVNCDLKCATCGWNPREKTRRIRTGKFENVYHRTNVETGEIVPIPDGAKQLVFEGKGVPKNE